jgi:hypothetical protein
LKAPETDLLNRLLEPRQMLSITVNTPVDERDFSITDGDISLRDAIEQAPIGQTINFAPSISSITLIPNLGELAISKNLTISGNHGRGILFDANTSTVQLKVLSSAVSGNSAGRKICSAGMRTQFTLAV